VRDAWIRGDAVESLVTEHAARRDDHHVRLWQLMSLDAWHRSFLSDVPAREQTERLERLLAPVEPSSRT
jgi:hypothetical protein